MATERTVLVRLKANVSDFQRGMVAARSTLGDLTKDIDTSNNRTTILAQSILGLGPAFVPLSAAAVPVLAGMSTQLLMAGGAAAVLTLAMVGIGDGLKALNTYQLEPTAQNLEKMQIEMEKLGPAGEHFVRFLDEVGSQFGVLQDAAREGLFPGVEDGITHLLDLLPQVQVIVRRIAEGMGQLASEGGKNLSGPKFESFFRFLETDAQPILIQMGRTLGNFTEGLANMVVAFAPMSRGFSGGLLQMSRAFAEWSRNLDSNQSFQSFLQYIQESGPRALDFLQALIEALAAIVEAAAPVGAVLLPAFTALLNVISAVAETPLGPVIIGITAAISLYARAVALAQITTGGFFGKLTQGWRSSARESVTATGQMIGSVGNQATAFRELSAATEMARLAQVRYLGALRASSVAMATTGKTSPTANMLREVEALNLANQRLAKAQGEMDKITKSSAQRRADFAKAAGGIALLGVAASGVADKIGLANTANFALLGTLGGPWGAVIGASIGALVDFADAADNNATAATERFNAALKGIDPTPLRDKIKELQGSTLPVPTSPQPRFTGGRGAQAGQYMAQARAADQLSAAQKRLNDISNMRTAKEGAANMALLREGLNSTAEGSRRAAMTTQEFAASLVKMNEAITGKRSLISYEAAIDDFTKSLKDNGRTLDINTAKGRANKTALLDIAENALGVAKTLKGVDRERFLDNARRAFIRAAREAGLTRRAAERLANQLLGLDGIKPKPKIDLDTDRFKNKRDAVNRQLNDLNGRNVKPGIDADPSGALAAISMVEVRLNSLANKRVSIPLPGSGGNADGGIPFGPVVSGAIYGPGGPKDDLIHALLSNGEHVWTAAEVAAAGGHAAMYAMRQAVLMGMPAFADGGRVDRARHTSVSVAAPRLDLGGVTVMVRLANGQTQRGTVERVVSGRGELLDARRRDGVRT